MLRSRPMRALLASFALLASACGARTGSIGGASASNPSHEDAAADSGLTPGEACRDGSTDGPFVLASPQQAPQALAVDDTSVYWADVNVAPRGGGIESPGRIMKVSKCGGTPITLSSIPYQPTSLVLSESSIYWTAESLSGSEFGAVMKLEKGGGNIVTLANNRFDPTGIALDATALYWIEDGDLSGNVMKVSLDGGPPVTLATSQDYPSGIAVDPANVYWDDDGAIMKVPKNGGTPGTLAVEGGGYSAHNGLYIDATGAYRAATESGVVLKVGLDGGIPTTLASGQVFPGPLTADSSNVYWGVWRAIVRAPKDGGTPVTFEVGIDSVAAVAVDDTSIYCATTAFAPPPGAPVGPTAILKLTPK